MSIWLETDEPCHKAQQPERMSRVVIACVADTCSFSLYLWQQPFYYAHAEYGLPLLPALCGALASSAISFYFWEDPLRHYLNNKWALYRRRGTELLTKPSPNLS